MTSMRYLPFNWSSQIFFRLAIAAIELGVWPAMYSRNSQKLPRARFVVRRFLGNFLFMSVCSVQRSAISTCARGGQPITCHYVAQLDALAAHYQLPKFA